MKVLTVSAVMLPLSVWVMFPLTAFSVSVFFAFCRSPTVTVPSSVRLDAAESVALPPVLTEPSTASFSIVPTLFFSSSLPTASLSSLSATNSPLVSIFPSTRVPLWTPRIYADPASMFTGARSFRMRIALPASPTMPVVLFVSNTSVLPAWM